MSKYEIKSTKGAYTIEGTDKLATIKKGSVVLGQIKQIVTNKYEVKNKISKIGILTIFGAKLTMENTTKKELAKIDCRKGIFAEDILKNIIKVYFE